MIRLQMLAVIINIIITMVRIMVSVNQYQRQSIGHWEKSQIAWVWPQLWTTATTKHNLKFVSLCLNDDIHRSSYFLQM